MTTATTIRNGSVAKIHITQLDGARIETWYDRKSVNWISQLKDSDDNQIGHAEFDGHKGGLSRSIEMLAARWSDTPKAGAK